METLLDWAGKYSPFVVIALAVGAAFLYLLKLVVEKAVAAQAKDLEMRFERRSTFEEKVLNQRFDRIVEMTERLQRITTVLNRMRSGQEAPTDFMRGNELVSLTEVYEDLNIHRLILGETFHGRLEEMAGIVYAWANTQTSEGLAEAQRRWLASHARLREAVAEHFPISRARW